MRTLTIARRELSSFFFSPIAYLVITAFVLLTGLFFMLAVFRPEQPVSMQSLFNIVVFVLVAILPAISMRLLSEELRSGTIESLLTSPLTDGQIIVGKWLGALGFFLIALLPTMVYLVLLEIWSDPDYGPILSGYVGLLFVGGFYLAIGLFVSSLTHNQIIAWVMTFFIILALTVATAAWAIPRFLPDGWAQAVMFVNVNAQYEDFAKGLIDISNLVYFASGIALFLVLAIVALQSRKWC